MSSLHVSSECGSGRPRAVTGFVAGVIAGAVAGALFFGARQWVLESALSSNPDVMLVAVAVGLGLVGGAAFGGLLVGRLTTE